MWWAGGREEEEKKTSDQVGKAYREEIAFRGYGRETRREWLEGDTPQTYEEFYCLVKWWEEVGGRRTRAENRGNESLAEGDEVCGWE